MSEAETPPEAVSVEPSVALVLQLGPETTVAQSTLLRRGMRLGVGIERERLGVHASLAGYPVLGRADLTATVRDLIDRGIAAPKLSRVILRGDLLPEWTVLPAAREQVHTALALIGPGIGLTYTVDDATYAPNDYDGPLYEWSPTVILGGAVDTGRGLWGIRVRGSVTWHNERGPWGEPSRWYATPWMGLDAKMRLPLSHR